MAPALLLASCSNNGGGNDDEPSSTGPTPSASVVSDPEATTGQHGATYLRGPWEPEPLVCAGECARMDLTTCTCAADDPCGWIADGFCDNRCEVVAEPALNDAGDCQGVSVPDPGSSPTPDFSGPEPPASGAAGSPTAAPELGGANGLSTAGAGG
jgi:hypothetical protein